MSPLVIVQCSRGGSGQKYVLGVGRRLREGYNPFVSGGGWSLSERRVALLIIPPGIKVFYFGVVLCLGGLLFQLTSVWYWTLTVLLSLTVLCWTRYPYYWLLKFFIFWKYDEDFSLLNTQDVFTQVLTKKIGIERVKH